MRHSSASLLIKVNYPAPLCVRRSLNEALPLSVLSAPAYLKTSEHGAHLEVRCLQRPFVLRQKRSWGPAVGQMQIQ
jgi:hypothetical protein